MAASSEEHEERGGLEPTGAKDAEDTGTDRRERTRTTSRRLASADVARPAPVGYILRRQAAIGRQLVRINRALPRAACSMTPVTWTASILPWFGRLAFPFFNAVPDAARHVLSLPLLPSNLPPMLRTALASAARPALQAVSKSHSTPRSRIHLRIRGLPPPFPLASLRSPSEWVILLHAHNATSNVSVAPYQVWWCLHRTYASQCSRRSSEHYSR